MDCGLDADLRHRRQIDSGSGSASEQLYHQSSLLPLWFLRLTGGGLLFSLMSAWIREQLTLSFSPKVLKQHSKAKSDVKE
ncbi:hypothetical protein ATANTOWER_017572 [Ataeniobius toweri]|uniref:Uncharacterized protein n=1 Tax=Ataeniobius toweri TaxID=208326 RepID=A0ABU7CEX9_9TELE|nr:hypothetical protein [Ataeniobius toweri]